MKTLIINKKIELLQVCIDLLEHIRNYTKYADLDDRSAAIYSEMGYDRGVKRSKRRAEISRMVAARLTERYNKILKAL